MRRVWVATALLLGAAAATVAMRHAGGWVVITVEEVPDALVAGDTAELRLVLRGHGSVLMRNATPVVVARHADRQTRIEARPLGQDGRYAASLPVTAAGEWGIEVQTGVRGLIGDIRLLPMPAYTRGAAVPALAERERGRRLFVAKGCVTCHVSELSPSALPIGPDLRGRSYPADYIARFLRDPTIGPSRGLGQYRMPALELTNREIAALTRYLSSATANTP